MKTPLKQQRKRVDTSKMSAGLAKKIKAAEAIRDRQDEKKKKEEVKKYKPTALEEKNLKDATENKNMRPPFEQKRSVSKKTAYDIKEASNSKLTASARKHYARNAQAAMKNTKKKQ